MRSSWKHKFILRKIVRSFNVVKLRSAVISKRNLGTRVFIYNGQRLRTKLLKKKTLYYKFGQFSLTKKLGKLIHNKKKKKKKKR